MSEMPKYSDPPHVFERKKNALLQKVTPMTLIPLASANGMLLIGSGMKISEDDSDCFFPLPQFLIFGGAISLSLVVLAVIAKNILELVLANRQVTPTGKIIISVLDYLGTFLASVQLMMVFVGSAILYPNMGKFSSTKGDKNYCQYGGVIFTFVLLTICWAFILYGTVCYLYIRYQRWKEPMRKTLPEVQNPEEIEI